MRLCTDEWQQNYPGLEQAVLVQFCLCATLPFLLFSLLLSHDTEAQKLQQQIKQSNLLLSQVGAMAWCYGNKSTGQCWGNEGEREEEEMQTRLQQEYHWLLCLSPHLGLLCCCQGSFSAITTVFSSVHTRESISVLVTSSYKTQDFSDHTDLLQQSCSTLSIALQICICRSELKETLYILFSQNRFYAIFQSNFLDELHRAVLGGLVSSHLSLTEENGPGNKMTCMKAMDVVFGEQLGSLGMENLSY